MTLSDLITAVERAEGPSREIDGKVMFTLFAKPAGPRAFLWPEDDPSWSFAGKFDHSTKEARKHCEETIEWQQSDGSWILMNSLRVPELTASIDAVVALIRREMSGASYGFTNEPPSAVFARVNMTYGASGDADHITEALALLLAFLRAARARQENDTP